MAKSLIERAALTTALSTSLAASGWTGVRYEEGFDVEDTITPPIVAVHFLPSGPEPLQLGGGGNLYERIVQIDCYMENENRASAIIDDVMDFIDMMAVVITDPLQANAVVGSLTCPNTDSIYGEVFAPNMQNPSLIRWRAVVRATLEAHYID